ncbi:MAG: MoxR family ATPase [Lachnospiraceae bacterium]|nr:MoxR family ATPase [Lachnospiraceae bacterium]
MNIKEAKEQVRYTVMSYLSKSEYGEYKIPVRRQRPLFLVGPPGIGKTDIMAQVADEMDLLLVSYSMTHHTRQSALGLPYIQDREYAGRQQRITEYTMSEIIASIYDVMESTGKKEGILFLDEINCISETLQPSMLQFLQNKTFGKHAVPDGWVIITAGNPVEYNDSVKEFDMATLDRVKEVVIEPEFSSWYAYALDAGIHGAVLTYLNSHRDAFYSIKADLDGKKFVTARGWVDLSEMMLLYEENKLPVDYNLVSQYVKDDTIAREFVAFYDLFFRYQKEYGIEEILQGKDTTHAEQLAKAADFDERLAVIQQLGDALLEDFKMVYQEGRALRRLMTMISEHKEGLNVEVKEALKEMEKMDKEAIGLFSAKKAAGGMNLTDLHVWDRLKEMFLELEMDLQKEKEKHKNGKEVLKESLAKLQERRKQRAARTGKKLDYSFTFVEKAFEGDKEMLLFVTNLARNRFSAFYLMNYGSEMYHKYSEQLQIDQREQTLIADIEKLGI